MLRQLFDNGDHDEGGMVAAMDHDEVVGVASGAHSSCASAREAARIEIEAKRVAREAADELQRSRRTAHRSRTSNIAIPTWTGRSGGAGAPSFSSRGAASKLKPGSERSVSSSKVTMTRSESEETRKRKKGEDPTCAFFLFPYPPRQILEKIRQRQAAAETADHPNVIAINDVMRKVVDFLRARGGKATTTDIINSFAEDIGDDPAFKAQFRQSLKQVAVLERPKSDSQQQGSAHWVLRRQFDGS